MWQGVEIVSFRIVDLEDIARLVIAERKLCTTISTVIPESVQGAAGWYSVENDTVHIDKRCDDLSISEIYTMVHELRHAEQYTYPQEFSPLIGMNLSHVIMYDGTARKRSNDTWLTCKVSGEPDYLRELYLRSPMEVDANDFARSWLTRCLPKCQQEIERSYMFWCPPFRLLSEADAEQLYWDLFNFIEKNAK